MNIDYTSGCLQLAEQSVELRKEKENLALLQQKRKHLQESLHLKKLIKSSLVQNMAGASEVRTGVNLFNYFNFNF